MDSLKERLGLGFLFIGSIALFALFDQLPSSIYGLLCVAWLGVLVWLIRVGALPLFGPVLSYDMIRIGRRVANFRMRTALAVFLGLVAAFMYYSEVVDRNDHRIGQIPLRQQAKIGQSLFEAIVLTQFLLVVLLTPAYSAVAITEEKERKTLEFLLATDLRSHEIIFGKLASRVLNLMMFVLAGLPVLGVAQLFGGIDPQRLLYAYATTLLTILSFSAVSLFASVRARRVRNAVGLSYLLILGYQISSFILMRMFFGPSWATFSYDVFGWKIFPQEWTRLFAEGNIIWAVAKAVNGPRLGFGPNSTWEAFRDYSLFHGLVVVVCVGYCAWRLRPIALHQLFVQSSTRKWFWRKRERPLPNHPRVGNYPMCWKEIFVQGSGRYRLLGRWKLLLLFAVSLSIPLYEYYDLNYNRVYYGNSGATFERELNDYTRGMGMFLVGLLYLRIAIRGATCVAGERDQNTLDELLTTQLTVREILFGKLAGCVLGVRGLWFYLLCHWTVAIACGALHWLALPFLLATTLIYANAFAWIGIYLSFRFRSTLRAILAAIITTVIVGGGYLFIVDIFLNFMYRRDSYIMYVVGGFSPAWVETFLCRPTEFGFYDRHEQDEAFRISMIVGLIAWLTLSYRLASNSVRRFAMQTNRQDKTLEVVQLQ